MLLRTTALSRLFRKTEAKHTILLGGWRQFNNNNAAAVVQAANNSKQQQHDSSTTMIFTAAAAATTGLVSFNNKTHCEATTTNDVNKENTTSFPPNPLWPEGVSEKDVDILIDEIMKDPKMNLRAVPDVLERQIYKSTIYLTMNLLYEILSDLHGLELGVVAGYRLQIHRFKNQDNHHKISLAQLSALNETILEQVAERLLENNAVNLPLVPDWLERNLYMNCLKLIFRVLDTLAATFRFTFCGHDLTLSFEPSPILLQQMKQQLQQQKGTTTTIPQIKIVSGKSMTPIQLQHLKERAKHEHEHDCSLLGGSELAIQLHASLYGLVLGIIDDLLANTEIDILSDRLALDIVESNVDGGVSSFSSQDNNNKSESSPNKKNKSLSSSGIIPFTLGMSIGALVMIFIGGSRRA